MDIINLFFYLNKGKQIHIFLVKTNVGYSFSYLKIEYWLFLFLSIIYYMHLVLRF